MPITQSRMIELISAAEDYQQAHKKVCKAICAAHRRMLEEPHAAVAQLEILYESLGQGYQSLLHPTISAETIMAEKVHFRATARANDKRALAQRLRRGNTSVTEAPQAPQSLRGPGPIDRVSPYRAKPEIIRNADAVLMLQDEEDEKDMEFNRLAELNDKLTEGKLP